MRAYIISDYEPTSARVREVLLRAGYECPLGQVVPLGRSADAISGAAADVFVVVLSPDPGRGLTALTGLRPQAQAGVLAVGPTSDTRLVLDALHSGANDYVDEADLGPELQAALRRLMAGVGAQAEPGRLIALLAARGGSGVSTLAANLGTVLAKEHKSALLLDFKHATGNLADLLDLKPTYTLADLCQNADKLDRVMFERSLVRHASGVHLLAPPQNFRDVALVSADGVRQVLALARTLFPYVVTDLDYTYREEEAQVLRQADVVLLVLRLDFSSLRNTQRAMEYLAHLGVGPDRLRLVANRYGQPKEVPVAKAEEALGAKIAYYVPEDCKSVNRAGNDGVPLVLESPTAKISRSFSALAHGVNGRPKS